MSGTLRKTAIAAAVGVSLLLAPVLAGADVAYILRRPAGDRDVSIIFSYDREAEAKILKNLKTDGHILLWQIQCAEKYVFYRPFQFSQGRLTVRPVLCLSKKFECQTDTEERGYVFQGYVYLDPAFTLESPINITLADKVIKAQFR